MVLGFILDFSTSRKCTHTHTHMHIHIHTDPMTLGCLLLWETVITLWDVCSRLRRYVTAVEARGSVQFFSGLGDGDMI